MKVNSSGFYVFSLTTLAMLAKGISYLSLGRPLPILVALLPATAIMLLIFKPNSLAYFMTRLWAWLVLIWAGARLFIGIALLIPNTITENHVFAQFGPFGTLITLLALLAALFMLRAG